MRRSGEAPRATLSDGEAGNSGGDAGVDKCPAGAYCGCDSGVGEIARASGGANFGTDWANEAGRFFCCPDRIDRNGVAVMLEATPTLSEWVTHPWVEDSAAEVRFGI